MIKYSKMKNNDIYLEFQEIVNAINRSLTYSQKGGKKLYFSYLDAKFNRFNGNRVKTDDYIEDFNEDGTSIQMCNIQ